MPEMCTVSKHLMYSASIIVSIYKSAFSTILVQLLKVLLLTHPTARLSRAPLRLYSRY